MNNKERITKNEEQQQMARAICQNKLVYSYVYLLRERVYVADLGPR